MSWYELYFYLHQCMFWHNKTLWLSPVSSACETVPTQIAAMTALHIYLNGNYLSKHTHTHTHTHTVFPLLPVAPLALQEGTDLSEHAPRLRLWLCPVHHVSQSVECQLIRLLGSCAGSSYSVLQGDLGQRNTASVWYQTLDGVQVLQWGREKWVLEGVVRYSCSGQTSQSKCLYNNLKQFITIKGVHILLLDRLKLRAVNS